MRLPQISRIVMEDLPDEVKSWVAKLIDPINNFMLTLKNGLNKGITVNDNLSGAIKTLQMSKGSLTFSYGSSRPPQIVVLGGWVNISSASWAPTASVTIKSWTYQSGILTVLFDGMHATDKYNVSLIILDD